MRLKLFVFLSLLALPLLLGSAALASAVGNRDKESSRQFLGNVTLTIGSTQPLTFVPTKLVNLSQAYIKLTGVDLSDDKLIDDFAAINYCNVMREYFKDEFAWRQAREAVRATITRNLETYPEYFYILGTLPLGRYDFEKKAFLLDPAYQLQRTGQFSLQNRRFECENFGIDRMPTDYTFRLTNPITLEKIDIPENKAFAITRAMEQAGNSARVVYVAFYLRVNDFSTMHAGGTVGVDATRANVRATLLSLRLYLDPERKQQIFEYTGE
jgi:hypothetical protein